MFLDVTQFDFVTDLQRCSVVAKQELAALTIDDFLPWPQVGAYEGDWRLFAMWLHEPPPNFDVDYAANRRKCQGTVRKLESIGRIHTACYSWLGPGGHILAHTDAYYPGMIRAHLCLRIPPMSLMRVNQAKRALQVDEVVVIDGQVVHEVANLSAEPRVTLLVDVAMNEREQAYIDEVSRRQAP